MALTGVRDLYAARRIILKPLSIQHGMPLLSYETDGCAVAPAVLRQVDVHIQQVLEHSARTVSPRIARSEKIQG